MHQGTRRLPLLLVAASLTALSACATTDTSHARGSHGQPASGETHQCNLSQPLTIHPADAEHAAPYTELTPPPGCDASDGRRFWRRIEQLLHTPIAPDQIPAQICNIMDAPIDQCSPNQYGYSELVDVYSDRGRRAGGVTISYPISQRQQQSDEDYVIEFLDWFLDRYNGDRNTCYRWRDLQAFADTHGMVVSLQRASADFNHVLIIGNPSPTLQRVDIPPAPDPNRIRMYAFRSGIEVLVLQNNIDNCISYLRLSHVDSSIYMNQHL